MPQETGNHEDVRWAEITDEKGHGLRISRAEGAEPFAMSLQPYSSFMLEEAQHQDELPAPKHMFLRVLAEQMGVGGDDSWMSPVHPQYHIPGGPADQPRRRPRPDLTGAPRRKPGLGFPFAIRGNVWRKDGAVVKGGP